MAKQDLRKETDEYFLILNTIITDILQDINYIIEHLIFVKQGRLHTEIIPINEIVISLKEATFAIRTPFLFHDSWKLVWDRKMHLCALWRTKYTHFEIPFNLLSEIWYTQGHTITHTTICNIFTLIEIDQTIIAVDSKNITWH